MSRATQATIDPFKTEAEEAEWWYKNRTELDKDLIEAAKEGKLKRPAQKALKAQLAVPHNGAGAWRILRGKAKKWKYIFRRNLKRS
jgi:hypothetical protein